MEKNMTMFNDSAFVIDFSEKKPEERIKQFDLLKTKDFSDSIASFAEECETPMTIGLQGDWGTGKTSLMNMIKGTISDKQSHKVDINTWHYSMFRQDEYLGIIVIKALMDELAKRFEKQQSGAAAKISNLGKVLGTVAKKAVAVAGTFEVGIGPIGATFDSMVDAVKGDDNKEIDIENLSAVLLLFKNSFKKVIEENVTSKGERIYFFIDDLDRIKPVKAVEVLETLKNFMDVDGCVFILAVDYEIVQLGIQEKFGKDIQLTSGKSFFDKIIQLPFSMPTSSYNLQEYLKNLLTNSKFIGFGKESNDSDIEYFVDITEVTIGRNPRSIKRAINYASLLEKIRSTNSTRETKKDKLQSKLLYTIVCMQIAWPELFEYFILHPTPDVIKNLENWDFLEKLPNAKKLFNRVSNPDETKENISAFFDTLYSIIDIEGKDGVITKTELEPLLKILQLVKLTSEKTIKKNENPLESFVSSLSKNVLSAKDPVASIFFKDVFLMSKWVTNDRVEYKKAGERYLTIVYNRKQVGSVVTLGKKPLLIRLKESFDVILDKISEPDKYKDIIRQIENGDSLTGIGDTEIAFENIQGTTREKIEQLNEIFNSLTKTLL